MICKICKKEEERIYTRQEVCACCAGWEEE